MEVLSLLFTCRSAANFGRALMDRELQPLHRLDAQLAESNWHQIMKRTTVDETLESDGSRSRKSFDCTTHSIEGSQPNCSSPSVSRSHLQRYCLVESTSSLPSAFESSAPSERPSSILASFLLIPAALILAVLMIFTALFEHRFRVWARLSCYELPSQILKK